ncbi:short-chain dehydrogenase/reductase SDR [Rubrobacter xylanophilus DSM 9941]|uniref:Short-chain dehydrogenase/reductase SDR n=1 Tax=Rubrobacter xylanophilus (strain DSM 9941 / JCM 11954 / NBRC 16129 / PRD-1) TaxID=266117 RepID=Q1AYC7_RUBXD|nr:SDR family oxidoreductase [Rubrobacter xylanophilus]ABG03601.1 short-chain dehydrogenase/reductase SDR [Rubrobacter xylanophilus DSM 9941]
MPEPKERVAVVTGAARGIGRRVALELAARGYAVAANDLRAPGATLEELEGVGARALALPGDVADERAVRGMVRAVEEAFGRVDVLVNNAGISLIKPAEETTPAEWRRVVEVNLTGPFLTCRYFGFLMLRQGSGSIVNVSSVAGLLGISDRAAYNASKHGLVGLTRTLAAEWGGRGVRVNAVCPGWVKTEMDAEDQAGGGYTDEDIAGRTPMGRFATPEDVAAAVAFLADSGQSGYVNGHALSVDGGWYADGSWESLRRRKQAPSP